MFCKAQCCGLSAKQRKNIHFHLPLDFNFKNCLSWARMHFTYQFFSSFLCPKSWRPKFSSAMVLPQFTHMHETLSSNWMPSSITVPTGDTGGQRDQTKPWLPEGQWTPTEKVIRRGWERSPGTAVALGLFHQVSPHLRENNAGKPNWNTEEQKEKLRSISTNSPSTSPVKDTGALTPRDKGSYLGPEEKTLSGARSLTP